MPDPAPGAGTLAGRLKTLERQIIALRTRISAGVARTDLVADAHKALLAVREIEAMVPAERQGAGRYGEQT